MDAGPLKVVQWASGAVGRSVLRSLLDRPEFELAGVRVYDPAKHGVDAGRLAGRGPVGIAATSDDHEIFELDADCVVYAPLPGRMQGGDDFKTVCELLASGKNVVSLVGFVYPRAHGEEVVQALERACATGGTSVHGTGISPGFTGEKLPLVMSALTRRVDHVYIRECFDFAGHPSRRLVHDVGGFGKSEEEYVQALPRARAASRAMYSESLHLMAAGLGVELDSIDLQHERLHAGEDFMIASGPIAKGTVAAARWIMTGRVDGQPLITLDCSHKTDARKITDWFDPGYALRIQGTPSLELTMGDDWITNALSAGAAHALNSVPAVCAAAPGIRTALDLPMITGRFSPR